MGGKEKTEKKAKTSSFFRRFSDVLNAEGVTGDTGFLSTTGGRVIDSRLLHSNALFSSTKEPPVGCFASTTSCSDSVDETVSLASSSFSMSSEFSSIHNPSAAKHLSVGTTHIFPATSPRSLPLIRHEDESPKLANAKAEVSADNSANTILSSNGSSYKNINSRNEWKNKRSNFTSRSSKIHNFKTRESIRQLRPQRLPSQILHAILSLNRDDVVWEEIEDDLFILLDGNVDRLLIFEEFFLRKKHHGREGRASRRWSCELMRSLAYLLSSESNRDMTMHDEHVSRISSFLSTGRHPRDLKLAAVECLAMQCLLKTNEYSNSNNSVKLYLERMFEFLTSRRAAWDDDLAENLSPITMPLLCEIRARCLRDLDLERERIRSVTDKGNTTAILIAAGAKIVEIGIKKSNKAIEEQIHSVGNNMRVWMDGERDVEQCERQNNQSPRKAGKEITCYGDAVVLRAFSDSAKRASEYARQGSTLVAQSSLDRTLSSLCQIGNKFDETTNTMTDHISPESREIIRATGKVGMASVGAVALVADAVLETSKSVSSKTVGVTADIVGHKYGSIAGDVARDTADTYDNVLQTMGNITLVSNGTKLVKTVTKNVGKNQIDGDIEQAKRIVGQLERRGAFVAKHALGIQWAEGSLTKELICGPAFDGDSDENEDRGSELPHQTSMSNAKAVAANDQQ